MQVLLGRIMVIISEGRGSDPHFGDSCKKLCVSEFRIKLHHTMQSCIIAGNNCVVKQSALRYTFQDGISAVLAAFTQASYMRFKVAVSDETSKCVLLKR